MSMKQKAVYTYAWDFLDEGVDVVLERIKKAGGREVIVAMAYHAGRFLLPHNPKRRIYYPEDGVVYFKADKARYAGQRLKPLVASIYGNSKDGRARRPCRAVRGGAAHPEGSPYRSEAGKVATMRVTRSGPNSILGGRDLMGEIIEKAKKLGISVTAWFVCFHNSRLGFLHPGVVARNAFGDPYYHYLCPMNQDASGYVLNLLDDFTSRYACDGVFLESLSYSGFGHGYHHEFYGVTINAELSALLGLCFCEACRRAAEKGNIDVERLAASVRKRIDTCVGKGDDKKNATPVRVLESIGKLCGMNDFLRMRCERVGRLLEQTAQITRERKMRLDFFGPVFAPVKMSLLEGVDLAVVNKKADRYVLPIEEKNPALVENEIRYAKQFFNPEKIVLSLRLLERATSSQRNLKAKAELAERHGLAGCNFYNYGMVPLDRLNWLTSKGQEIAR